MKKIIFTFLIVMAFSAKSQTENLIIVTTDGFRWQEVFGGMDSAIAKQRKYNQGDSTLIFQQFWSADAQERRKKLMPFFWNTIATKGQIYGNRYEGNYVNVFNPHWFSYPGYSEIFCGFADTAINSNNYPNNPHTNVLEFFNQQAALKNKVAVFGAWNAFERIFNKERSKISVINAYDLFGGDHPNTNEKLINEMLQHSVKVLGKDECLDVFTHYGAMEYLKKNKPKVMYISYGETDEWAHDSKYRNYLDAAHNVDEYLQQLWNYIQSDPQYKNKTTLLITVDHGRGDANKDEWRTHGSKIMGADQIWFAVMGPNTSALGEMNEKEQLYQQQLAATMAQLMGFQFTCEHEVAPAITSVLK